MVCKIAPTNDRTNSTPQGQEVADYETALDAAGYGRFSRNALGACVGAFFTTGVENCIMSYVLPAARCDLSLTTYQIGLINMAFMSGGTASAFFWGIVGDVVGLRKTLAFTLVVNAAVTLAQSWTPDYKVLLAARCVNGFLVGGPSTLVFTYLSDLVGLKRRQFYLNVTGMSFVVAWLVLPAVAWLVIPFKAAVATYYLPLYSWRMYLALASIPSFIAGFWIIWLPESPRLLTDTNRPDQALKILDQIYRSNGGKDSYKIRTLIKDKIYNIEEVGSGDPNRIITLFIGVLKQLKIFVSKAYALKSSLILFVFFANMAAGFGLNFWVPEILLRMQSRDCQSSKPEAARLFDASNATWKELTQKNYARIELDKYTDNMGSEQDFCDETMNAEIFISGLIVGACCVIGNAICAVLSSRSGALGIRRAAAACAVACALACACLAAVACSCSSANKIAVAAAAILTAASLNGNVLLIRLLLHALPAKLSALGVCWGCWWGRAGGLLSNLAIGALLDYSCPAPFIAVAVLLTLSVGCILMIKLEVPDPGKSEDNIEHETVEKNVGLDRYISTHM